MCDVFGKCLGCVGVCWRCVLGVLRCIEGVFEAGRRSSTPFLLMFEHALTRTILEGVKRSPQIIFRVHGGHEGHWGRSLGATSPLGDF